MVVFVAAIHPIFNIIVGFVSTGTSFLTSFKITSACLKRCDPNTKHYESITIKNKIIIDDQQNSDESVILENTIKLKKKVNFNNVVHFRSIPNKDESPKSEIWYGNNDYIGFRNEEIRRRREKEYNLQEMMSQVEEDEHINRMLESMQEKERQQELDRIEKEKFLG